MNEIQIGRYTLPVILMVILALVYKPFDKPDGTSKIPDWGKIYIAVAVGIGLGILALFMAGVPATLINIVGYILDGFYIGAGAVGIFNMAKITPGIPITPPK